MSGSDATGFGEDAVRISLAAHPIRPAVEMQVVSVSGVVVGAQYAVEELACSIADIMQEAA